MEIRITNFKEGVELAPLDVKLVVAEVSGVLWVYAGLAEATHSAILKQILTKVGIEFETTELKNSFVPEPAGTDYRTIGMGYVVFGKDKILLHGNSFIYGANVGGIGEEIIAAIGKKTGLPVYKK